MSCELQSSSESFNFLAEEKNKNCEFEETEEKANLSCFCRFVDPRKLQDSRWFEPDLE